MRRILLLAVGLLAAAFHASAAAPQRKPVLLAYARDYQLEMLLGQYDPENKQRWLPNTHAFTAPGYQAPFTLFGPQRKIDTVRLDEEFRMSRDVRPWEWDVAISSWNRGETRFALAVSGHWPDVQHPSEAVSVPPEEAVAAVAGFLQKLHLKVPAPRITQVLSVDLRGDGEKSLVICANSDPATLPENIRTEVYSVALLWTAVRGTPALLPLRVTAYAKAKGQTLDDYIRIHGRPDFYQVLAVTDLAGDARPQIWILNDDRNDGPEIDLYELKGDEISHPLAARKLYF